jgi:hypothetical protein
MHALPRNVSCYRMAARNLPWESIQLTVHSHLTVCILQSSCVVRLRADIPSSGKHLQGHVHAKLTLSAPQQTAKQQDTANIFYGVCGASDHRYDLSCKFPQPRAGLPGKYQQEITAMCLCYLLIHLRVRIPADYQPARA